MFIYKSQQEEFFLENIYVSKSKLVFEPTKMVVTKSNCIIEHKFFKCIFKKIIPNNQFLTLNSKCS